MTFQKLARIPYSLFRRKTTILSISPFQLPEPNIFSTLKILLNNNTRDLPGVNARAPALRSIRLPPTNLPRQPLQRHLFKSVRATNETPSKQAPSYVESNADSHTDGSLRYRTLAKGARPANKNIHLQGAESGPPQPTPQGS